MEASQKAEILRNFIGGQWLIPEGKEVTKNVNPANTNEIVAYVKQSTRKEVEDSISAAEKAFPSWSNIPAPQRGDIILQRLIQFNYPKMYCA